MAHVSLIILNAAVWTGLRSPGRCQAIAVSDDRIVATGSNADISSLAETGTKVINAGGKLVLPGFNDSHAHLLLGGRQLMAADLRNANNRDELAAMVASASRLLPRGRWLTGGNWDNSKWADQRLPVKEDIDPFTPTTPVFVTRSDLHMGLANSAALAAAGITAGTPEPSGGAIMRHPVTGEPTGILKDAALELVRQAIPSPSIDESLVAVGKASELAASLGVTSLQDMAVGKEWESWDVFQTYHRRHSLTVRLSLHMPLADWVKTKALPTGAQDAWLRLSGVKAFVDGSLGSSTALFFAPYDDEPDNNGLLMHPVAELCEQLNDADITGLQAAVHAIGDKANNILLNIFSEVAARNGRRDRRFRVEHAQHLSAGDIDRIAALGAIASVQPSHVIDDGRWAERRIGPERAKFAYPFRSLTDAGVMLAFGSDWPVASLNPLEGIQAAVTRKLDDGQSWHPEQRITVEEAVKAYTANAAFAEFAENEKGTLSPGMLADFIVLSRDIFTIPPDEIATVQVVCTVCGGRVIYEK
ncbi:amidohydrolase [Anaeroselena agilis]|uniref:Amidohydrolase n=1 Tax=Anaeroselena agilis TaxID=3063788 RepID=A0ABU3NVL2_9FIRM|nr:amidohydrolase [Selenomonadales bacterium 4137-cl]